MIDPTTEAGRRILLVHIDGDGFIEPSRTHKEQLSPEVLIKEIYQKYPIPQTVSLIQGEVDSIGIYPKLSPRMKEIAKKLYKIPWIEPASHTLSHPFFWKKATQAKNATPEVGKKYHLPIPNYYFSLEKETVGSIRFALSLAPKSKRKKKLLFWSGDCLPTKKVLAYIERKGILAMNGGDTTIQKNAPWLSHIAPFGLQHDEYWQIYTGEQDENVYTNEWRGPFWGYRHAIETFELTEKPYRLKPIDIYYHFYSGSKLASLKALKEVYDWALRQKTSKLYASQYIQKVKDFYNTSLANKVEGGYEVQNSGHLRTLRMDKKVFINMQNSQGVAGFIHNKKGTYITLDRQKKHTIILSAHQPNHPYLKDANGWIERVEHKGNRDTFVLKANMPLEANFYLPSNCKVMVEKGIKQKKVNHQLSIKSTTKKGSNVVFICQ